MGALTYRIFLTCINIFFPPLAVAMLCGFEWDCMLNCCFFLLAVIPSHIHGFYISCTYFHRRRKVKKGRYPGGPKSMIHSKNVINGGASDAEVDKLWRKENGLEGKSSRSGSMRRSNSQQPQRQGSNMRRQGSYRPEITQRHGSQPGRTGTNRSRMSDQHRRPDMARVPTENIIRDGYGAPQSMPSTRLRQQGQATGYSPISPQVSQSSRRRFEGF